MKTTEEVTLKTTEEITATATMTNVTTVDDGYPVAQEFRKFPPESLVQALPTEAITNNISTVPIVPYTSYTYPPVPILPGFAIHHLVPPELQDWQCHYCSASH
jgi:hypothetical protein